MLFSEKSYGLAACELMPLEDHRARTGAGILCGMDPWRRMGYTEGGLHRYLTGSDPSLKRYAVAVSSSTAGVVSIRFPWLRGPFLELLAVFPPYQGMGLGRQIVQWMADACAGATNSLWTTASAFNTPAREFYRHLGFTEAAVLPDLMAGGFSEILLRKRL